MSTPLANRTTISSRNKMALLNGIGNHHTNNHHAITATATKATTTTTTTTSSRLPPRTTIKPLQKPDRSKPQVPATSSRIALSRSRLSGNGATSMPPPAMPPLSTLHQNGNSRTALIPSTISRSSHVGSTRAPSTTFSRSSSKASSISSSVNNTNHTSSLSRQTSSTAATPHTLTSVKKQTGVASTYIPDTNVIRKGLAKFSNPIECQRQFQALSSKIRELNEINDNKETEITKLRDQLKETLNFGVGYATTVQYFAKKLKLDSDLDLEHECERLKSRVDELTVNEKEYESKLESIVDDYKNHLEVEQHLKDDLKRELEQTRLAHRDELSKLKEAHNNELADLLERHSELREKLENRIEVLESDLKTKCKELADLRIDHEELNTNFNKLEESLTKDKEARVRYAQEKVNQLQKDVDSLNCVLEMKTEKIHALERDSILLGETQHELMISKDQNKALKQQLESMTAALDKKRELYENLLADHEKISSELKRERKERRRMTMRTEQLEFVLNESCANESNITVLDSTVVRNPLDTSVDRIA